VDVLTRTATLLITQRLALLSNAYCSRPKIKFLFKEGEIICALFGNRLYRPVSHFLKLILGETKEITCCDGGSFKYFDLKEPLKFKISSPRPLFASNPTLLYCLEGIGRLILGTHADQYFSKFPVIGVVISGNEILPNVTALRVISQVF
ncbi:hypothetical protein PMAYCL1PPCAC_24654, partial [Pristionchus mayeri]